ncbi:MAG TPA: hypothetical protein VFL47_05840, partial [Flavisolibacter sp.]|nr:hypothetical protein [Flavisolibacter sp.]
MQGDFEKKVQAKMEQLNMVPSAPVWEKVALQIRPEKRRRRLFVWLFLGVVLLGGGWLIATQQTKAPGTTASQNVSAKPASIPPSDVSSRREKNQSITESRIVHSNIPPTKITHQISGIKKEVLFKNNNRQKQAERKPRPEESFSRQPAQALKENSR